MEASELKKALSPGPTPAQLCQAVDEDALLDKIAEYDAEKVFSLFDFKSLEKEEVLNTYLETTDIVEFANYCANPGPSPEPSTA
jgi:adenine-specific DNA methylase